MYAAAGGGLRAARLPVRGRARTWPSHVALERLFVPGCRCLVVRRVVVPTSGVASGTGSQSPQTGAAMHDSAQTGAGQLPVADKRDGRIGPSATVKPLDVNSHAVLEGLPARGLGCGPSVEADLNVKVLSVRESQAQSPFWRTTSRRLSQGA